MDADQVDAEIYPEEFLSTEDTISHTPQNLDRDTFKQRNDPGPLLLRLRLQLMNAYKEEVREKGEDGKAVVTYKIKYRKNTKPKANKQGIEDIITYVEKYVNSHTVQGNTESLEEFRNKMRNIANDITIHFIAKRKDWDLHIRDVDTLISTTIDMIDIFLTRTLFNEERKGYGDSYKESTHREIRPETKPNFLQRVGHFLGGRNG